MFYRMSSTGVLEVAFEDDIYQEKLAYTGETINTPHFEKPSTAGKKCKINLTKKISIHKCLVFFLISCGYSQ